MKNQPKMTNLDVVSVCVIVLIGYLLADYFWYSQIEEMLS